MTSLYVVATPIGNLEDITLRALRMLREVDLIACENVTTTRKLLARYGIKARLISYREANKHIRIPLLLRTLETQDVALVSEAGTPTISDPGYELILAAIKHNVPVVSIPGPSAITAALAVSGLPSHHFLYLGFLPRRSSQRRRAFEEIKDVPYTLVAFEAPHRLKASLEDMRQVLGDRAVAVVRELSKLYEEVFRGSVSQAIDHFQRPIGEFTLVIEGTRQQPRPPGGLEIEQELRDLKASGGRAKEAVSTVAKAHCLTRREVYRAWLRLPRGQ